MTEWRGARALRLHPNSPVRRGFTSPLKGSVTSHADAGYSSSSIGVSWADCMLVGMRGIGDNGEARHLLGASEGDREP